MAASQGQDIVRCQLCKENAVELHCNFCRVDFCFSCIPEHMSDKTKRHEIVEFISRTEGPVLPDCESHAKRRCETYCKDCRMPTCVVCVTDEHKMHDITSIDKMLLNFKQIIIGDVSELENKIRPKYTKILTENPLSSEVDNVLSTIKEQEEEICQAVRRIGSELRNKITQKKMKPEEENTKMKLLAAKTEKELNEVIKCSKGILGSNDAKSILNYQSRTENYRNVPNQIESLGLIFLPNHVKHNQLKGMFGLLKNTCDKTLQIMLNPVVVSNIQSPFGSFLSDLWDITCEQSKLFWTAGNYAKIYKIDVGGSILKTVSATQFVTGLSLHKNKIMFTVLFCTKIYKYNGIEATTFLDLSPWYPTGLSSTANSDLLVSMRSRDELRSRVVRYTEKKESKVIEYDKRGTNLFSTNVSSALFLTENSNGDICVCDFAGKSVVVVDASGDLRFKYCGNISEQSKYTSFTPIHIVTDVGHRIIISDYSNDTIHVLDCDGHFVCYIEYPCNGGLKVDGDHNLVVGERKTGKIRVIKYLE